MIPGRRSRSTISLLTAALAALVGCSGSSGGDDAGALGGPVPGPADEHCASITPIVVNQASCHPTDTGAGADAGAEQEAPILYNAEGDDDDCKYHVSFTSTPAGIGLNQTVTLNVAATLLAPPLAGTPATNAAIIIESYLADDQFHVLPTSPPAAPESPAGSGLYKVTPVRFDRSGRWVVRFHLYEDCSDLSDDSPHGHVAFYVDVP